MTTTRARPLRFAFGILLIFSATLSSTAWSASSLDSETSIGSTLFSEGINYNGNDGSQTNLEKWNWNLGYTYTQFTQAATSTTPEIVDATSQVIGGLGYREDWEVGGGLSYSVTPAESLHSFGPNFYAGYTFYFEPEKQTDEKRQKLTPKKSSPGGLNSPESQSDNAEEADVGESQSKVKKSDEPFRPSLTIKGLFGFLGYTETVSTPRSKTTAKRTMSETIHQSSFGIDASGSPASWITLDLAFTKYHYDKNVNQFLAALDQQRAVHLGASNFASTLAGFPTWMISPQILLYQEVWSLELDGSIFESESDHSHAYSERAILSRALLASFTAGVGIEHDYAVSSGAENLGLIRLGYDF